MSDRAFNIEAKERRLTSPHQKCDGKRPCTTCVIGDDGTRCTYEQSQRSPRISTDRLSVAHNSEPSSQSVYTLPFKTAVNGFSFSEPQTHTSSDIPLSTTSSLPPPLAPRERPLTPMAQLPREPSPHVHGEIMLGPSPDAAVRNTQAIMECIPRHTVPPFTVLPSLHFRTVPRPLQVPLSLIPPERVQVSPIARGDLDMTLYVLIRFLKSHQVVGTEP